MADGRLMFTGSTKGPKGRCSDIAIHDNVMVMVFDRTLNTRLYYRLGTIEGDTVIYGNDKCYASGKLPSVALVHHNDAYCIIATHQPDMYTSKVNYCRVGKVNINMREINYWGELQEFKCAALKLKVSASNNGRVIIVHEKYYSYDKLCYHIGTLNHEAARLDGIVECHEIDNFSGVQPSLDIHDNTVVMVYHSRFYCELKSIVGTIEDNGNITWGRETPLPAPCKGIYPSISLNAHGDVVESHQSKFFRRIEHVWGRVQGRGIEWVNAITSATFGEYPTLSLADNGLVLEAHKTNFGRKLYLSQGRLNVRREEEGGEEEGEQG